MGTVTEEESEETPSCNCHLVCHVGQGQIVRASWMRLGVTKVRVPGN
jgi:hypothetical protein